MEAVSKFKAGEPVIYASMMGVIKSEAKVLEAIEGLSEPAYKIALVGGGKVSPVFESELSPAASENYIRVDEDDMDKVIRVYDSDGEVFREFEGPRSERRYAAEVFAAAEAKRLGCEWGSNYG